MNPELLSLRKKLVSETKRRVREDIEQSDVHIVRSVNALQDLDATANLLAENCREWYQTVFPELERQVTNPDTLLKIIAELGETKNFSEKKLDSYGLEKDQIEKIVSLAKESAGTAADSQTMEKIQTLALQTVSLRDERKQLEAFIEKNVLEKAPNFGNLCTPILAGKMIAKAGSIQKLAELPASALQVQGAEKALFAHLKNKKQVNPPKHGFLFNHPLVQKTPGFHRGKMARTLAAKLSICLKADVYGTKKTVVWKDLQIQLEKRLSDIQKLKFKPKKEFSRPTERNDSRFSPRNNFQKPFVRNEFQDRPRNDYQKPFVRNDFAPTPNPQFQKPFPRNEFHLRPNGGYQKPFNKNGFRPAGRNNFQKPFGRKDFSPNREFSKPKYPTPDFVQADYSKLEYIIPPLSEPQAQRPKEPKPAAPKEEFSKSESAKPVFSKTDRSVSGGHNPQHPKKPFYKKFQSKKFKKR
ncbi:MAG: NOP5/NOP56 family protein [Candidatus Micrarchaeota archaeon]